MWILAVVVVGIVLAGYCGLVGAGKTAEELLVEVEQAPGVSINKMHLVIEAIAYEVRETDPAVAAVLRRLQRQKRRDLLALGVLAAQVGARDRARELLDRVWAVLVSRRPTAGKEAQ